MSQTTILDETIETLNDSNISKIKKRTIQKSKIEPTDEFVKVSKYLNLIFAYNNIPLNLVPISLFFAQKMEFKTNILYLLIDDKKEIAAMLDISVDRVNKLITQCKKYDIIRSIARGKFLVNSFLFSTGSIVETRDLQAHFDLDADAYMVQATQKNLITGNSVRKVVMNKKNSKQIPGQLSFDLDSPKN